MDAKLLGGRIKSRRTELNMTQGDIATAIGVAISTIQRYEAGTIQKIKLPVVEAIARILQVNADWLIGKTDELRIPSHSLPDNIISMPKMKKIPILGTIACGQPILAYEEYDEYASIPEHIRADFALRCKGDSMINARIFDGDIVYIRQQPDVENGQIAAVLIEEEATLKRVRKFPDHLVLEAENPMFQPLTYWREEMNTVRILGLAVAFTSSIRHAHLKSYL